MQEWCLRGQLWTCRRRCRLKKIFGCWICFTLVLFLWILFCFRGWWCRKMGAAGLPGFPMQLEMVFVESLFLVCILLRLLSLCPLRRSCRFWICPCRLSCSRFGVSCKLSAWTVLFSKFSNLSVTSFIRTAPDSNQSNSAAPSFWASPKEF